MKTRILKSLIVIIILVSAINAKAQTYPDYVITIKGDSVPCKIIYSFFGGNGKYRTDTIGEDKKISSDEIKEVYIAKTNFLSRAVYIGDNKKPTFLTVLEKGKISLFEQIFESYSKYGSVSTVSWYAGKGSDNVETVKGTGLKLFGKSRAELRQNFTKLLIDNKDVYDKFIADNKFDFDDIRNIVHLYNTGKPFIRIIKIDETEKEDKSNDFNPSQN